MNEMHLQFLSSPEWTRMLERDLLPWVENLGDLGDDVLEVGPGPGLTTDLLRTRVGRLTAIELDPTLAESLTQRMAGSNVDVMFGDGISTGFEPGRFSAATCFAMLHHMPSADHQDRLFLELNRVLRPGAIFVGTDSRDLEPIRMGHVDDIFVPADPDTLPDRFSAAGFDDTEIFVDDYQFRFVTHKRAG